MKTLTRAEAIEEKSGFLGIIKETYAEAYEDLEESALTSFYIYSDQGQGSYSEMTPLEFDCHNDIELEDFNNLGASEQMTLLFGY
jgi:hypothetical protein